MSVWLMPQPFTKPYLPVVDQLALLKARGLVVTDEAKAIAALSRIGYYRLSGYWYPMRASVRNPPSPVATVLDDFRPGTEFGQVLDLYVFDKKLRLLTLDAIERVEVALRTDIALLLGRVSPTAHRDPAHLDGRFARELEGARITTHHAEWLARLDKAAAHSREEFAVHFRRSYTGPLPIWIVVELWDFGMLSRFLSGMRYQDRATLAARYGLPRPELLTGWMRSINFARNVCAHHSRLWNRPLVDQPPMPRAGEASLLDHLAADQHAQTRFYAVAAMLRFLLAVINPTSSWAVRLADLIMTLPWAPGVSRRHMGFPDDWLTLPLWQREPQHDAPPRP